MQAFPFTHILIIALSFSSFKAFGVIVEKLFNQVNVGQQHSTAAITFQAKLIQSISENEENEIDVCQLPRSP